MFSVSDVGKQTLAVLVSTFTIEVLPRFNSEMAKPQDKSIFHTSEFKCGITGCSETLLKEFGCFLLLSKQIL